MKIAFVLLDAEVTGGQVVALELMRAAREAGHEPLAVLPRRGPMLERLVADKLRAFVVPLTHAYRLDQAARLARLLRRERIDLVDTHTLFSGEQLSHMAASLVHVPVVVHAHIEERFSTRPPLAQAQRLVARAGWNRSAAIIAVSEHVRDTLVEAGVHGELVTVIRNGIRLEPPAAYARREELCLLCVARLAPVKGQSVLLEALAEAGHGVRTVFAGSDLERGGAYAAELQRLAATLGVDARVEFLGHREDVPALLDAADALVLPSYVEGLPLVVVEAMERGRAVVATAAGGTPEVVLDDETGLLVEPGSARDLAGALRRLRDEPGLLERLGRAGRERVEREFRLEQTADRTLAVYAAAAASRPASDT